MFEEAGGISLSPCLTLHVPLQPGTASKQFSTPAGMDPVSLELTHISVSQESRRV